MDPIKTVGSLVNLVTGGGGGGGGDGGASAVQFKDMVRFMSEYNGVLQNDFD